MKAVRQTQADMRGKVVLRMRGSTASPLIMEAASRVARTFRGELHGLFIENEELLSLAGLPFAREISLTGRRSRTLSIDVVRREMQVASTAMQREFERMTNTSPVPASFEVIRGAAEDALKQAFQHAGILAIGEPLALATPAIFEDLLCEIRDISGLVVVGSEARRAKGSVLTVIDPGCDVALLVDTAEKIAKEGNEEVILLISDGVAAEAARLEDRARAALDVGTTYRFVRTGEITPRSLANLVTRHRGGLVIARIGGPVASEGGGPPRFACAIDCPLLLLR